MPLGKVDVYLGGRGFDEDGELADCAWIGVQRETDLELELEG